MDAPNTTAAADAAALVSAGVSLPTRERIIAGVQALRGEAVDMLGELVRHGSLLGEEGPAHRPS